jgi:peptidoglycan hydrolase-like protein with peptidoglycan-binding domain
MCTSEVQTLQRILNKLGYTIATTGVGSPGRESMLFGPFTQNAVIRFQKANDITRIQVEWWGLRRGQG